jgi:manganese transport protein
MDQRQPSIGQVAAAQPQETAPSTPGGDRPSSPVPSQRPPSLEDVHSTVSVKHAGLWRRLFAFSGPAYLVSVGYMDPGNWATDIEGGSRFSYELIWVLLMSNLMAVLLQTLAARLGIVSGRDLAQACRESYSRPVGLVLWVFCEVAIAACDLAEVIGTVVALNLLFGLAPLWGLLLTTFDTFLFLAIQRLGIRKMEAFILVLVFTIGLCFLIEIVLAQPQWSAVAGGFVPHLTLAPPFVFSSDKALYVGIGILGATVMPHNLYLHSALVQTRRLQPSAAGRREACRFNLIDSAIALNAAFLVNAAILVLAAATFYEHPGLWNDQSSIQLQDAQKLLERVLGTRVAPIAFAIALLASGQSSTITGTLAGQVVMEGFVHLRIRPWARRMVTRLLAIVPALAAIALVGEQSMMALLVLSQVVLSLQLPFAVVPLVQFTSDRRRMGEFTNPGWVRSLGWVTAAVIILLNGYLVANQVSDWMGAAGPYAVWVGLTAIPVAAGCGSLLLWLIVRPWLIPVRPPAPPIPMAQATAVEVAADLPRPLYRRIGVALDNSPRDAITLRHAAALARGHGAELVLLHVVEGVGGQIHGQAAADQERLTDQAYLEKLSETLRQGGLRVRPVLRFGNPAQEISQAAAEEHLDLLVLGSHGHGFLGDRLFGDTMGTVQHAVHIPVLAVREPK